MMNWSKALGVSVRARLVGLVAMLGTLSVICVSIAAFGLTSARSSSKRSEATFNIFRTERDAYEGWLTDDDQSNMVAALAALHDRAQLGLMQATAGQVRHGYATAVSQLQTLATHAPTAALRAEARQTLADVQTYNGFTTQVLNDSLSFNAQRAVRVMTVGNIKISNQTQADFDHMGAAITARAAAINRSVGSTVSSSLSWMLIVGIAGVLIAIAVTVLLVRSITRPLAAVTAAAARIAQGDVNVEVDVNRRDEIGQMAEAFRGSVDYLHRMAGAAREIADGNLAVEVVAQSEADTLGLAFAEMRAKVAGLLGRISHSSDLVGAASQQLADSGRQAGAAVSEISDAVAAVAAGAEDQVRSLAQAKELTDEVTAGSEASAADALETAEAVRSTRELARDGARAVERATEAMGSVRASSAEISDTIKDLGAMSTKIGGIVDTITAIAEQTNLLALNAAIEAARAGDHGRGFAVVAEEVRVLAEESQTAAASIGDLVAQIQAGTDRAVHAVTEGTHRADEGAHTVDAARDAFLRIDEGVQNMSERVERITAAVTQIAAAGGRMQDSIAQVLAVSEQSSASAEEVAASSQETSASTQQIAASAHELSSTAAELRSLVNQFVLPSE